MTRAVKWVPLYGNLEALVMRSATAKRALVEAVLALTITACAGANAGAWTPGPPASAVPATTGIAAAPGTSVTASGSAPAGPSAATASAGPTPATASAGPTPAPSANPSVCPATPSSVAVAPGSAAPGPVALALTIATGEMIGKPGYPIFLPSDFTLPANADVTITVTNFDGATPLLKGYEQFAKATGLVGGTFSVTPVKATDPNGTGGATVVASALDPKLVSHTLTIAALGINIPIAANARETFTIHTGAAGRFAWRCLDPCGTGPTGFGGAMSAASGYMQGTATMGCCC